MRSRLNVRETQILDQKCNVIGRHEKNIVYTKSYEIEYLDNEVKHIFRQLWHPIELVIVRIEKMIYVKPTLLQRFRLLMHNSCILCISFYTISTIFRAMFILNTIVSQPSLSIDIGFCLQKLIIYVFLFSHCVDENNCTF